MGAEEGILMYKKKMQEDIRCPLEYGLQVFGGKWKSRILCVLAAMGTLRYSELRAEMTNVTDAVLASSLKELIEDHMVERRSYDVIPPKVTYSLTERGKSVLPILQSICSWSGIFHKKVTTPLMKQCQKCDYGDL
jgi:DNA-binding HxlR family transcriptional regulator